VKKQPDSRAHLISISRLSVRNGIEVSVQRFRGAVRQATIHDFESRLREGGERSPYYIVDLSELEYIEAAGLGRLLEQSVAQARRGGWLRVVAPSSAVEMILKLSGVSDSLFMAATEDDALRDLPERAA